MICSFNLNKELLTEGSRDNMLLPYLELVRKKSPDVTVSQLKQFLLKKFVNEANIRNLSLGSNYYLAGVARYYFDGSLTANKRLNIYYPNITDRFIPEVTKKLDTLILHFRNKLIDSIGEKYEQPEDFGTLSLEKLFKKYKKIFSKEDETEVASKPTELKGNYSYEIMYSHEDCKKYKEFTEPGAWCITYGEHHYDNYTKKNATHFIILRSNGFENVPREVGDGYPTDRYGLSLLAIQQSNKDGSIVGCTTRWNHGGFDSPSINGADDMFTSEVSEALNMGENVWQAIFKEWQTNKATTKGSIEKKAVVREYKYAQMKLNGGQRIEDVFEPEHTLMLSPDKLLWKVKIGNFSAVVLKRKVLFDTIMEGNFKAFYVDDCVKVWTPGGKNVMVYDVSRRRFVGIDGITKFTSFKCVKKTDTGIVRAGNRYAYIKENFEPLQIPNGQYWVDTIIHSSNFIESQNFLCFLFDSAAQVGYIYSKKDNSFITNGIGLGSTFVNDRYISVKKRTNSWVLFDTEEKQPLEIYGNISFADINSITQHSDIALFKNQRWSSSFIFDFRTNKYLETPDGKPITDVQLAYFCHDFKYAVLNTPEGKMFLNLNKGSIYMDKNGKYIFENYTTISQGNVLIGFDNDATYEYSYIDEENDFGLKNRMPVRENAQNELAFERLKVNTNPSEGQKKAGNYRMGHVNILGFNITIENPKGSYRKGKDGNGKEWKTLMKNDYGYFTRTVGKDGDAIDVFIGGNLNSEKIFAVDQKVGGKFDETKVMLGFNTEKEAKDAYNANYSSDWKGFDHITEVDLETFRKWLYDGHRQRKPFWKYVEIKKNKMNEEKKFKKIYLSESQAKAYTRYLRERMGYGTKASKEIRRMINESVVKQKNEGK